MVVKEDFDKTVSLPRKLTLVDIRKAAEYMEKELADFVDIYYEQANVFSAIVGILGTRALDQFSSYEKHRHKDIAQQRFPDLKRRGSGASFWISHASRATSQPNTSKATISKVISPAWKPAGQHQTI